MAWLLGLALGLAMPAVVGFYHRVRDQQSDAAYGQVARPASPAPAPPQAPTYSTDDTQPIQTRLQFRMVSGHRRGGKAVRPGRRARPI